MEYSFKDFLLKHKQNRVILLIGGAAIIIQFAIFKYYYPFASYIHGDSFSYIKAAYENPNINTYPIGYSKFLRLISIFSNVDVILALIQYLLIQISALFLVFSLFYFYNIRPVTQLILLFFIVFNPLSLHLGNLVSSDGLFLSLSCTWFALLLWIIHRPSAKILICHAVIIFIAFTVRYNALIYPIISAIAFGLSNLKLRQKLWGFSLVIMLCGLFIGFTSYQYKKLTGYWQFSPFSGWQLANNAMYTYRYVTKSDRKPVPKKFQVLDNMIREYFDSTRDHKKYPDETLMASTVYMWTPSLPLYKYRNSLFKKDTTFTEFKKWASVGPFYKEYGSYIIKKYPFKFIRYFLWPNANKYYAPPIEFLEVYNSGYKTIPKTVQIWFGYNSTNVKMRLKNNKTWILDFYPILSGIINLAILFLFISYLTLKGWKSEKLFGKAILLGACFWLINAGFTIFASSAALRFQSFPIILATIFFALLIDWMVQLLKELKEKDAYSQSKNEKVENLISTI